MAQVTLKAAEGIAVLSVDRPEALNALNREIVDQMDELIDQVAADDSVRCLVIHSDKNFAAGADIKAMAECDEEGAKVFAFSKCTYHRCYRGLCPRGRHGTGADCGYPYRRKEC